MKEIYFDSNTKLKVEFNDLIDGTYYVPKQGYYHVTIDNKAQAEEDKKMKKGKWVLYSSSANEIITYKKSHLSEDSFLVDKYGAKYTRLMTKHPFYRTPMKSRFYLIGEY